MGTSHLQVKYYLDALRIAQQNELLTIDYHNLMLDGLNEASDERIKTLREIERDKLRVARAYNKRVKNCFFKLEILFGKRFCLSGPKATSLGNGHQTRKDRIELRK
jgi:hypothetical protein